MPRPRSSTFYLPLAPADAPLSLKAKLSVLPPSAANALLAPRNNTPATTTTPSPCMNGPSTHTPVPPLDYMGAVGQHNSKEDECARLERVLGLSNSFAGNSPVSRRTGRRHTDAPLPQRYPSGINPFSLPPVSVSTDGDEAQSRTRITMDPSLVQTASISASANNGTSSLGTGSNAVAGSISAALGPDASSTTSTTSPRIGASEMDAFASACEFGAADLVASTNVVEQGPSTDVQEEMQGVSNAVNSNPSIVPIPSSRPVTVERRRLSMVPCGLAKVWACRTQYPSKLCLSVSADEASTTTTSSTLRQPLLPHQIALPPLIASCGSLHPMDARHLLPRHLRMSFPPPPPPCPAAAVVPELCAPCDDGIKPELSTVGLSTTTAPVAYSTHSPADETAVSPGGGEVGTSSQMVCDGPCDLVMSKAPPPPTIETDNTLSLVRITLTPPGPAPAPVQARWAQPANTTTTPSTPPPRQRYRLAPLYLPKVLRRTLGLSAWARAETVRLARAVEQSCGYAYLSQVSTVSSSSSSSTIGRHTQWDDIVRSGYTLPPCNATTDLRSSLVWSGYEDVYVPGEGDQANNSAAAFSGQLSVGGANANVWIQNVFDSAECAWDIDLEDEDEEEDAEMEMEMDLENEEFDEEDSSRFVRESAPEPEERRLVLVEPTSPHTPVEHTGHGSPYAPVSNAGLGLAVVKPELQDTRSPSPDGYGGYAAVGKFTWESEWPASPTIARPPTGIGRQWSVEDKASSWRMEEDNKPSTPYHPVLSPSVCSSSSSASTSSGLLVPFSQDEEENIFRYSPLQDDDEEYSPLPEEEEAVFRYSASHVDEMDVDLDDPQGPHMPTDFIYEERSLLAASPSTDMIPISLSPSFPPPQLIGTKISSCSESEDESDASGATLERDEDEFYDVPSPTAGVFVIPPSPSPLTTTFAQPLPLGTTFGYSSPTVAGPSTPTSASRFAQQQQQTPLIDEAPRRSLERIRSSRRSMERIGPAKRSMEWIKPVGRGGEYSASSSSSASYEPSSPPLVAPRPRRASRALENVFSRQSPVFKTSALPTLPTSPPHSALLLPTSPPSSTLHLPMSPPLLASSPPLSSPKAAWTFGSLKSALSNSVSHLVELARSRSPSPLPWLTRGSGVSASSANSNGTTSTPLTLSGAAAALAASAQATPTIHHVREIQESSTSTHVREPSSEELEAERASCVTPTPTSSRPRRASSTTITKYDALAKALPVPQVQLETTAGEVVVGTSPPPKRTLSTSSLSSMESEPESESGSSGGVFSRSPSPEPDSRTWDSSHSLTPRSRPISADAKALTSHGRLSPMMIPGSWDPNEPLWDDEDVANDQLRI